MIGIIKWIVIVALVSFIGKAKSEKNYGLVVGLIIALIAIVFVANILEKQHIGH